MSGRSLFHPISVADALDYADRYVAFVHDAGDEPGWDVPLSVLFGTLADEIRRLRPDEQPELADETPAERIESDAAGAESLADEWRRRGVNKTLGELLDERNAERNPEERA